MCNLSYAIVYFNDKTILFSILFYFSIFSYVVFAGIDVVCYLIYMATETQSQGDLFYVIWLLIWINGNKVKN